MTLDELKGMVDSMRPVVPEPPGWAPKWLAPFFSVQHPLDAIQMDAWLKMRAAIAEAELRYTPPAMPSPFAQRTLRS